MLHEAALSSPPTALHFLPPIHPCGGHSRPTVSPTHPCRGALNAYSRALEMDPEGCSVAVWSNAAACFLQLGEYEQCVANCTRALEMLGARKARWVGVWGSREEWRQESRVGKGGAGGQA